MKRYGIATDTGMVAQHFGRCPTYTLVDIEKEKIINKIKLDNPGHAPGAIPKFLNEQGVNVMVAGGMGRRAIEFFKQYNIEVMVGVSGPIADVIGKLIKETVEYGDSPCEAGGGRGYGIPKEGGFESEHPDHQHDHHHQ